MKRVFLFMLLILGGLSHSGMAGIPYPPEETWSGPTPTPSLARPDYLATVSDPAFGTELTRITQIEGWRNHYPKDPAWNCDGSMMKLVQPYSILDAETFSILVTNGPYGEARWSYTDPQKLYHIDDNVFFCYTISNQVNTPLHTFTNYTDIYLGPWEGNLSTNDRYVVFAGPVGSNVVAIVYDIQNDLIEAEEMMPFPFDALDWLSISSSGEFVVMNTTNGISVYDRNLTFLRQISPAGEHGDLGVDAAGNEVFVPIIPLQMIRLDNGASVNLLDGNSKVGGGHVSCRNFKRPGWAYVSARDDHHEVFAIKLDSTRTVEHFVHDHNIDWSAGATPSPDGRQIVFCSSWGTGTTYYVYVDHMPENPDMDADGIPDAWEEQYGATNSFSGGAHDYDGDGASDFHEYVSDCNPTNPASFFTIKSTDVHPYTLTFSCSTARVYSLQFATNLIPYEWSMVPGKTQLVGEADGQISITDTTTYVTNYYRVQVGLP